MSGAPSASMLTRAVAFDRSRVDQASRTVPASLSSEEPVLRYGAEEVLSHDPAAVDFSRCVDGLPLLYCHDKTLPIGVVENVRLEGRRLVGVIRFGRSAKAEEVLQDVTDGVLRGISVGYILHEQQTTERGYTATKWTPYEASVIATPADITVGIGRGAATPLFNAEGQMIKTMKTATTVHGGGAEDEPIDEPTAIRELVIRHGMGAEMGERMIREGMNLDAAKSQVLRELAQRDQALPPFGPNVRPMGFGGTSRDRREMIEGALAARLSGRVVEGANPYAHARSLDLARDCLELSGVRTSFMSPAAIVERAMTIGDFPELLTGAGQRVLRAAYGVVPGIKRAFRSSTASNFRAKQKISLSEAPALVKVNEHGEFKHGAMAELKSTYGLATFGRIVSLTRQAIINDDLDAFGDLVTRLGRAAAEFESQFIVDLLTSNPVMPDGKALFHADHGNFATGAPSALQYSALVTARASMRLQKGMDGKTPIDATPRYLIVPAALEATAEQLTSASYVPTKSSDVNPFGGRLEVVVDPRLDAVSPTAWYLAASPDIVETIEYSYLESVGGPEVIQREGFDVDGVDMKVRLDFGAGVIDWRGLYRSAGA